MKFIAIHAYERTHPVRARLVTCVTDATSDSDVTNALSEACIAGAIAACRATARQARLEQDSTVVHASIRRSTALFCSATPDCQHAIHPHLTMATKPQPRTWPAASIPITPQAHACEHTALMARHAMRWHGRSTDYTAAWPASC